MSKQLQRFLHLKEKVFIFFLFFSSFSFAQQKVTVIGNVSTGEGAPLAGLSVNVKGSPIGIPESPLEPSGLIGPVTVKAIQY